MGSQRMPGFIRFLGQVGGDPLPRMDNAKYDKCPCTWRCHYR